MLILIVLKEHNLIPHQVRLRCTVSISTMVYIEEDEEEGRRGDGKERRVRRKRKEE